jgi:hypothetical protein
MIIFLMEFIDFPPFLRFLKNSEISKICVIHI